MIASILPSYGRRHVGHREGKMAVNINNYVIPLRLKLFRNSVDEDFTILDVGCGNKSETPVLR